MFKNIDFYSGDFLKINGVMDDNARFVAQKQLKDPKRWKKLTEPFFTKEDSDGMWRGEFFGKEMRGASLIYRFTKDEELYNVLYGAVKELLSAQEESGRISTYSEEAEFNGWDMWCRKYVLTGVFHFYHICKDEAFKREILSKLSSHADYIIEKIGCEDGKKSITATSSWWGCVNSCTILEPILELYRETKEERYLDFAKYIISTGGSSDCDFISLALENKLYPYQYPVVKAYETMSFFEGLLAYYEITGEEKYFTAVKNFVEAVAKTDMTKIGCSGCTHELFDNSSVKQTEYSEQIMQETCVTVTWMRLSARLFFATGDSKFIDRIEKSAFNGLYGSINVNECDIINLFTKKYVKGMTFDSYSPLYMNYRGRGTGGYQEFKHGGSCGCCEAIGACGVALVPLVSVMKSNDGVVLNYPFSGSLVEKDVNGNPFELKFESGYPSENSCVLTVNCEDKVNLKLYVRRPEYCNALLVNGEEQKGDGYVCINGVYLNGDKITVEYKNVLKVTMLNGKVAFEYGCITLAAEESVFERDLEKPIAVSDNPAYKLIKPQKGEFIRMEIQLADGDTLTLTDYQSRGKKYSSEKGKITVWFNG